MGIKKIIFEGHEVLSDNGNNPWIPNQSLNIITSKNGGGKTKLLEYIASKYRVNHNITHISASPQHFRCFEQIVEYSKARKLTRPPESRHFTHLYPVITYLPGNKELIQSCNAFFNKLTLDISLDEGFVQGHRLLFNHPRCKDNNRLALSQLSTGEKTAFILWLITKSEPKPNVLLLDEFDSTINDDVLSAFYGQLQMLSKECQIFITTNRWRYHEGLTDNKQFKFFTIDDGTVRVGKPHYLLNK